MALQTHYPIPHRPGEQPAYKRLDALTEAEISWNEERLRRAADSNTADAVALAAYAQSRSAGPVVEPLVVQIPEACRIGGFGRSTLYRLAREGRIRIVKVRGRSVVTLDNLRQLIAEAAKAEAA